jgi:hypothetical protein
MNFNRNLNLETINMELEFDKLTSALKANGTCLQGSINTTFSNLEKAFGEPFYPNSGDGKVICEWVLEFTDGTIATIYCWKVSQVPLGEYNWHIGGHSEKAVENVKKFLS